jgi:hypothetical protein
MSSVCDSYLSRDYHKGTGSQVFLTENPGRYMIHLLHRGDVGSQQVFGAHWSVLVTAFYATRYIVGKLVMCVPYEARYSLIIFGNVLYLMPVTDM